MIKRRNRSRGYGIGAKEREEAEAAAGVAGFPTVPMEHLGCCNRGICCFCDLVSCGEKPRF